MNNIMEGYEKVFTPNPEGNGLDVDLSLIGKLDAVEEIRTETLEQLRLVKETLEEIDKDIRETEEELAKIGPEKEGEPTAVLRKILNNVLADKKSRKESIMRDLGTVTLEEGGRHSIN